MPIRTALVLSLLALQAHAAVLAPRFAVIAASRAAMPGAKVIAADVGTECNTRYWFLHLRRGASEYLVLASEGGTVLRIVPAN